MPNHPDSGSRAALYLMCVVSRLIWTDGHIEEILQHFPFALTASPPNFFFFFFFFFLFTAAPAFGSSWARG